MHSEQAEQAEAKSPQQGVTLQPVGVAIERIGAFQDQQVAGGVDDQEAEQQDAAGGDHQFAAYRCTKETNQPIHVFGIAPWLP